MRMHFAQKAVIRSGDRVLLVRKSPESPQHAGCWEFPGGRLKAGESLVESLCREVLEEVGLTVLPRHTLAMWEWRLGVSDELVVGVIRACTWVTGNPTLERNTPGDHLDSWGWFTPAEVFDLDLVPNSRAAMAEALLLLGRLMP